MDPNERPLEPPGSGLRGRTDQSRGVDVVFQEYRQREAPDHGHLVADGDRRVPDHACSEHTPEARFSHFPFPGVLPKVLRENASECEADEGGSLVIQRPWPGMLRGFWNDPDRKRFKETIFPLSWSLFTGDGARKDPDGYYC